MSILDVGVDVVVDVAVAVAVAAIGCDDEVLAIAVVVLAVLEFRCVGD